jgi:hypothetical protein
MPDPQSSPVFDPCVLERLAAEVDSPTVAEDFATRYLELVGSRVLRIHRSLQDDRYDDAHDALLSLKATSGTVGAKRLEELSLDMEHDLVAEGTAAALQRIRGLDKVAGETTAALAAFMSMRQADRASRSALDA